MSEIFARTHPTSLSFLTGLEKYCTENPDYSYLAKKLGMILFPLLPVILCCNLVNLNLDAKVIAENLSQQTQFTQKNEVSIKQLRWEKIFTEITYCILVHKIYNLRRKVFLHQKMSERQGPCFQELEGHGQEKFSWGLHPHFSILPQSLKCLHPVLDQVKVSNNTSRKIRKIARLPISSERR